MIDGTPIYARLKYASMGPAHMASHVFSSKKNHPNKKPSTLLFFHRRHHQHHHRERRFQLRTPTLQKSTPKKNLLFTASSPCIPDPAKKKRSFQPFGLQLCFTLLPFHLSVFLGKGDDDDDEYHEQDGLSVHSPCKIPHSSQQKEKSNVELELKVLEALEIYPPVKLGGVHRHFVLYGLTEYLRRSFNRQFTSDDVLKLLDRFYNLEMMKSDDEETEMLNHEEDFCLPPSYFVKEDT